ncbi:MAG: DUF6527 family protein [Candidatus Dormibacteraeota bacterium]|nr:DUF6527 family protein [Candidatus Dormibacteraeota bacterium]
MVNHEFVEYIPSELKDGVLYVSVAFATVAHRCCCGCGNEVITPLSPTDWQLTFDGETISLDPSIGNWSFDCKSHYWIRRNMVQWAPRLSQKQIDAGRVKDRLAKAQYFGGQRSLTIQPLEDEVRESRKASPRRSLWLWVRTRLFRR